MHTNVKEQFVIWTTHKLSELVTSEWMYLTICATRHANFLTTIYLTIKVCYLLLTRASVNL